MKSYDLHRKVFAHEEFILVQMGEVVQSIPLLALLLHILLFHTAKQEWMYFMYICNCWTITKQILFKPNCVIWMWPDFCNKGISSTVVTQYCIDVVYLKRCYQSAYCAIYISFFVHLYTCDKPYRIHICGFISIMLLITIHKSNPVT